jgi:hypothetical protein
MVSIRTQLGQAKLTAVSSFRNQQKTTLVEPVAHEELCPTENSGWSIANTYIGANYGEAKVCEKR